MCRLLGFGQRSPLRRHHVRRLQGSKHGDVTDFQIFSSACKTYTYRGTLRVVMPFENLNFVSWFSSEVTLYDSPYKKVIGISSALQTVEFFRVASLRQFVTA